MVGMFTGVIRHCGELRERRGARHVFHGPSLATELNVGDSVAVNGACLTVIERDPTMGAFAVELSPETRRRTTFGRLSVGEAVNLELPLGPSERFDGHFVQGHVDAVGTVVDAQPQGEFTVFTFEVDPHHDPLLVEKGAVAVDGISLTCYDVGEGRFRVAVIPQTLRATTLQGRSPGTKVNVEFDLIGKYVQKQLRSTAPTVDPASQ